MGGRRITGLPHLRSPPPISCHMGGMGSPDRATRSRPKTRRRRRHGMLPPSSSYNARTLLYLRLLVGSLSRISPCLVFSCLMFISLGLAFTSGSSHVCYCSLVCCIVSHLFGSDLVIFLGGVWLVFMILKCVRMFSAMFSCSVPIIWLLFLCLVIVVGTI